MAVLFSSVDVRDLLSSSDVDDPSTPLSAPDLRLLIDRLQVHSLHIKSRVQSYIHSHHSDFSALFSQCSDVVAQSDQLSAQVFSLLSLISDKPIDAEINGVIQEIVSKRKEAREKRELLEYLGVVLECLEKLRAVEEDIRSGKVVEAAESLRELKEVLRLRDNDGTFVHGEESELGVYQLLTNEWSECFVKLQKMLFKLVENAVLFDQESNKVRVKHWLQLSETGVVELQKVLIAMDAAGILHYGLAKVADLMIKHVISPAVICRCSVSFKEEIDEDTGQTSEAVLSIASLADPTSECMDGSAIYHALTKVVEFINKSLCYESESWMHCFGRLTWPRMSELIISNFLSKVVPDDASKLADFQKVLQLSSDFESSLKELKFISSSDSKDDRLSVFTDNVEVHFATRKKIEILAKARYMLLQASFSIPQENMTRNRRLNNEEAPGTFTNHFGNLLFTSESCVISDAALKLMELVHKILKDVCVSSPRVGLEFYNATRDAILLYEAVIPVKLERQLETINQAAVLIHNDCHYLSQEILGLAFQYRPDFPSTLKELAVFVDLAPRFQMMAEEILERQIKLVISNLNQAIDSADGFQNTHLTKQYESAKFSIDQVAFILEKVHIIWEPLLTPSIYKRSMSMILEVVFSRIVKDILLLDDMAAEETVQLQRLIHLLLENLLSILESLSTASQAQTPDEIENTVNDLIPSLKKLRKLADLLDMPLKSITLDWESGELFFCGFTITEMEEFIMAIFTDSPLRKECLMRIHSCEFF